MVYYVNFATGISKEEFFKSFDKINSIFSPATSNVSFSGLTSMMTQTVARKSMPKSMTI